MDGEWLKWLGGVAVAALGWWNTMLHGRILGIEKTTAAAQNAASLQRTTDIVDARDRFVSKDTFKETMGRIEGALLRIENKLDGKADRE